MILTVTATPSRSAAPLVGVMAPAWAAIESLTRDLAAELGPLGIRVVCLRPAGIPETDTIRVVFGLHATALGMPFVSAVPEFGIFDLPFLFPDRAAVKAAVDGPLGADSEHQRLRVAVGFIRGAFS